MKRYLAAVLSCLMIGSLFAACATALPEHQRGAATKMGKPRQAQEQVVPKDGSPQPTAPQTQDEEERKDNPTKSK